MRFFLFSLCLFISCCFLLKLLLFFGCTSEVEFSPLRWNLLIFDGLNYFLMQSSQGSETIVKPATNKTDDKVSDAKYSSHSLDEVEEMVHNTISAYESKV